ncbi:5'-methylthioadenosine/adenosylhomocysteine nucleosidase [Piscinibacterium candidicorallinum]|uniref:adenosylhomocysteine nucleosidase n=1 Tax=Piscinibacterium candidicorallinum TaxID=1793872 RepID=A0ABV7H125_9BURK
MKIGLLAAMPDELNTFLADMRGTAHTHSVASREFFEGPFGRHTLVAGLARIGKVAATTTATVLIERFGVDAVVFTGTAGGLHPSVEVGDLVVADSFVQHDLDVRPLFPRYEVPYLGIARFASDAALTRQLLAAAQPVAQAWHGAPAALALGITAPQVHQGLIVSGDQFIGSEALRRSITDPLPDALAVEMEGAAVAQVCHDYHVPLASFRTISDAANDSAHVDFGRFISTVASRMAHDVIVRFLAQL